MVGAQPLVSDEDGEDVTSAPLRGWRVAEDKVAHLYVEGRAVCGAPYAPGAPKEALPASCQKCSDYVADKRRRR